MALVVSDPQYGPWGEDGLVGGMPWASKERHDISLHTYATSSFPYLPIEGHRTM